MCPVPTGSRSIGYLTESIWTPKTKSNTLIPKTQLADILTKGSFARDEWNHLLRLFNIMVMNACGCGRAILKSDGEGGMQNSSPR